MKELIANCKIWAVYWFLKASFIKNLKSFQLTRFHLNSGINQSFSMFFIPISNLLPHLFTPFEFLDKPFSLHIFMTEKCTQNILAIFHPFFRLHETQYVHVYTILSASLSITSVFMMGRRSWERDASELRPFNYCMYKIQFIATHTSFQSIKILSFFSFPISLHVPELLWDTTWEKIHHHERCDAMVKICWDLCLSYK